MDEQPTPLDPPADSLEGDAYRNLSPFKPASQSPLLRDLVGGLIHEYKAA